jgi:hypothetical protein
MKSTLSILAAASTLALLSACGGGDGGTSHTVGPTGLNITPANQDAVTHATVTGGLAVSNIQTATNAAGGGQQPTSVAGRVHSLSALMQRTLAASVKSRMSIQSASAHPAALADTQACGVSGSLTTTFDDRDSNGLLSAGDGLSVQFNDCRDSATSLYNGKAVITLTTVPSASQITASADFQNVSSVQGASTSAIDGSLVVAETDSDTESTTSLTVGTGALTITLASPGYSDVVTLSSGTRITVDQQFAAGRTALTYDGVLQAQSVPGGGVTLTTVSPIVQLDADAYPSSGVLKAKGQHGALLLTVLNATTVQEQLDADDDGTYESTTTVAWSTLMPS